MQELVDDFVAMNTAGLVLELCEKYYHENVLMLSNGVVFAQSMREAYDKQKGYVGALTAHEVKLLSSTIDDNMVELTFCYKMTGADAVVNEYTGKHIQTWENGRITREEYFTLE